MAHNLNKTNGKVSLAYYGETPWHGLGTSVNQAMTSAEAIELAGLNYEVVKVPLKFDYEGHQKDFKGKFVTVRKDTEVALGVVGSVYNVLQNKQAFSFFDAIVGAKEAMYHTAGALGKGERVWMLAKLPGYVRTVGDDITEKYLLLCNSHDGSRMVDILWTPIRVVCQNTLNIAIGTGKADEEAKGRVRLRHTSGIGMRIEEVREVLGIANQQFAFFEQLSQKLATVQMSRQSFEQYIKDSGVIPNDANDKLSTRAQNIISEMSRLFETGKGCNLPGAKGTLWGAFNSIIEYADYKNGRGGDEKRAESVLFGGRARMKQKAWDAALVLAK